MSDPTENSNLTQVLKSFQKFISIYENPTWVKNADTEDIKSAFKLGNFIEKTITTFRHKGFLEKYLKLLDVWGKNNGVTRSYKEEFFALACDKVLQKLFKSPHTKEKTLDIGVRVYTSLHPEERFKECIKTLILTQASIKAIEEFVKLTVPDKDVLESSIILNRWNEECKTEFTDYFKSEILSYLSLYNVEARLPRLISIMALEPQNDVRTHIIPLLIDKMQDRTILSKQFWLTIFRKTSSKNIVKTCKNYPEFQDSLLNFIEYLGGMMKREDSPFLEWTSDPNLTFCPEIDYFEMVLFLEGLCEDGDLKRSVLGRLEEAKEFSDEDLWDAVIKDISEYV